MKPPEWKLCVSLHEFDARLLKLKRKQAKIIKVVHRVKVRKRRGKNSMRTTGSVTIYYRMPAMQVTCSSK